MKIQKMCIGNFLKDRSSVLNKRVGQKSVRRPTGMQWTTGIYLYFFGDIIGHNSKPIINIGSRLHYS